MNKKEKIMQLMQHSLLYDGKEQLSGKAMSLVAYVYADTDKYWDDLLQEKLQPGIYSFGNLMIVYCQMAKEIAALLMPVKDTVLAGIDENIGEDLKASSNVIKSGLSSTLKLRASKLSPKTLFLSVFTSFSIK